MKPGLDASMEYFSSGATESGDDPLQVGPKAFDVAGVPCLICYVRFLHVAFAYRIEPRSQGLSRPRGKILTSPSFLGL